MHVHGFISTEELPGFGISEKEKQALIAYFCAKEDDVILLIAGDEIAAKNALKMIVNKIEEAISLSSKEYLSLMVKNKLRAINKISDPILDISHIFKNTKCRFIYEVLKQKWDVLGTRIPHGSGLFSPIGYFWEFAQRLNEKIKSKFEVEFITTDELPNYGIDEKEINMLAKTLELGPGDVGIIIGGKHARGALKYIQAELSKLISIPDEKIIKLAPDVEICNAPKDGVFPKNFYATTNRPTLVRLNGLWIKVKDPQMDAGIVVNLKEFSARCKRFNSIKKGDVIVTGTKGIWVEKEEAVKSKVFNFMTEGASSERPLGSLIKKIAHEIYAIKKQRGKLVVVAGPAVVHRGAGPYLAWLIRNKFVKYLLAGNALATHDIESALFGTSLGMDLEEGRPLSEDSHANHLRAINEIRTHGSIKSAIDAGIITKGIMYECIKNNVPFVLAGSIRDDGPLPEVITDILVAQEKMKAAVKNAEIVIMMATMLHSIATGNLLPSNCKIICVDINPAVITKLIDRGSMHAMGVLTDVGAFLKLLVSELQKKSLDN
jgi:lysine-ketoglutarate reductase/saccharopine dehydrogenase-like protein (TIGR00300 family)